MGTRRRLGGRSTGGEAEADGKREGGAVARDERMKSFRRTWERGFGREHSAGVLTDSARLGRDRRRRLEESRPAARSRDRGDVPSAAMIATAGWYDTPKSAHSDPSASTTWGMSPSP